MRHAKRTLLITLSAAVAAAIAMRPAMAAGVGDVFYIELENHNATQPVGDDASGFSGLYGNSAAPYLNSLITPFTSPAAGQVSFTNAYHSVLSTPTAAGNPPAVHPSEPNYIWQEAGSNLGIFNDNDPYAASNGSVAAIQTYLAANPGVSGQNLSGLLQSAGISWKSYQEGIDLTASSGTVNQPGSNALTNTVAPQSQWNVPLKSFSGTSPTYTNPYNGSHQYNYAAKHNPQVFFTDTNGGNDMSPSNPEAGHYAPLEQLQTDLTNNTVGRYNIITPDQFNDMHTALSTDFTYKGVTYAHGSDANRIAVGDNFLSQIVPMIMASDAYKNNGAIVIWTDETEGTNADTFDHTLTEIVISPLSKGSVTVGGVYGNSLDYTHSSDLATLQEIFNVPANTATGFLNDAANPTIDGTMDLSDLFVTGTIPATVPEPASLAVIGAGAVCLLARRRKVNA